MSDAVITGVGAVSALGVGFTALLDGLAAGRGAVGPIASFDARTFPTRVAGEVPLAGQTLPPHPAGWDRDGRLRDRKVVFALMAAVEAWQQAQPDPAQAGLSIALGLECAFVEDFDRILQGERFDWDAGQDLPPYRFRSAVDLAAQVVTAQLGLGGRTIVHTSACAAGALAVAQAAAWIDRGEAQVVLCGGADSMINPLGIGGMSRIGAPSPSGVCRPFDRRRDGLVMGEGAAMFVVEHEDHALTRGARPLARILGWGSTQDAYRATAPRPDGSSAREAMERALRRAGLSRVDYVNAHGTGTPLNDPAEARAIREALGDVPVSSIKGAVGHLMAASGALELAASLLAFERDLLPGTCNHQERDPECTLDVIGETPRAARIDTLISNSFGFGGQNASVVLGRV